MTKHLGDRNVNITAIELEFGVSSGVQFQKLGSDLVPVYEMESARIERGFSVGRWYDEMSEMEKALIIAQRRIAVQMRNLQEEAEARRAKQEARNHRKK